MDSTLQTGFIGLGVMGNAMAGHLLTAGYSLGVYTRTEQKAKKPCRRGCAMVCGSRQPREKLRCHFYDGRLPF